MVPRSKAASATRPSEQAGELPATDPPRPGWRDSLPFFVLGVGALVAALALLAFHVSTSLSHLPVWTYLLAIGSIALVGGTVGSLVEAPITDLPRENELVGEDLIVVSRARWLELNRASGAAPWAPPAGRSVPPRPPRAPAAAPAPPAAGPREAPVPTIDELLAGLPDLGPAPPPSSADWLETEDVRETPPPAPPTAPARPGPLPKAKVSAPAVQAAPAAPAPNPELEALLDELESEATKAIEARDDDAALIEPGRLTCAYCQRGIGITEAWENCEECLATYCGNCESQLEAVGDRRLCPGCRAALRPRRR